MSLAIIGGILITLIIVGVGLYMISKSQQNQVQKQLDVLAKVQEADNLPISPVQQINVPSVAPLPLNSSVPTVIQGNTMTTYVPPKVDIVDIPKISTEPVQLQILPVVSQVITSGTIAAQPVVPKTPLPVTYPIQPVINTTDVWASPNFLTAKPGSMKQRITCPNGGKVVSFNINSGDYLDSIGIKCENGFISQQYGGVGGGLQIVNKPDGFSKMNINSSDWINSITLPEMADKKVFGGTQGANISNLDCGTGNYINGLMLEYGQYVNKLGAVCVNTNNQIQDVSSRPLPQTTYETKKIWAPQNFATAKSGPRTEITQCPNNGRVSKINVKSGGYLDAIGIECDNGFVSNLFGGTGGGLTTVTTSDPTGFQSIVVKSGDWVNSVQFPNASNKSVIGGTGGSNSSWINCDQGAYLNGLMVNYGDFVNKLGGVCLTPTTI